VAVDSQTVAERHHVETTELRRQLNCSREDVSSLQQQLVDAGDRQTGLVAELRRTAQQLSSSQMELEASRAIASAQRETILVRDTQIARLETGVGLVERSLQQSSVSNRPHADDGGVKLGGTARSLPDVDLSAVSVTSCQPPPPPDEETSVAVSEERPNTTADDSVSQRTLSDNPPSLLAMWQQLQLNDSVRLSAGDSIASTRLRDRHSTHPTSARLSSALEEKARVQNRIKAMIGYHDPARKQPSAAAKPRMSVRPQPLSHSRSATTSSSTKQS